MDIPAKIHTREDYWDFVEHYPDKRFELIDGAIYELSPSFVPSKIAVRISAALLAFVDEHELGHVTGADGGYEMPTGNIYQPDVGFITKEHLAEIPERTVPMPSDFAVEVISPTDFPRATHRKAMDYVLAGTELVWVVYPENKIVDVYQPAEDKKVVVKTFGIDDTLDGSQLLPGFTLAVKDIFKS